MVKSILNRVAYIVFFFLLTACSLPDEKLHTQSENSESLNVEKLVEAPFTGSVQNLPKILVPEGFDWRQFEGIELKMISENTPPSAALASNIHQFEEVTGIKVTIEQMDLGTVIEKVGLDMNAKASQYDIIYADPFQILTKHHDDFVDLNAFQKEPTMPHIPGGLEDFIESHIDVLSYMGDKERLLALPYDASTMVLAYRKDIFSKYKDQFMKEKGYDWTPGPNLTWEKYYEISKWIYEKIQDGTITEVKYAIGHQAKRHDSLMNDFSNILASNGGDYFEQANVHRVGMENISDIEIDSKVMLETMKFYKELLRFAAPKSTSWDWLDLAEEFSKGDIAMSPQWHDYSAVFANDRKSNVAGKVGWAVLPKGKERHAHAYGGTGLAINNYASNDEKKAAWLFLVWATSPQSQYMILKSSEAGTIPTRYSVYKLPEIQRGMKAGTTESKQIPNLLSVHAALEAWEAEKMYVRPKIPEWQQVNTFIFTELSKMLGGKQSPEDTVKEIEKKSRQAIKQ